MTRFTFLLAAALLLQSIASLRAQSPGAAVTSPDKLKVAKGFKAELLYNVPKEKEGSWVNVCVDPKGRLIVSDQYGGLFRITPSPLGSAGTPTRVEQLKVEIGHAQGLLYAFDSLYVMVADDSFQGRGFYRVRDTDGDDQFDKVELLRKLQGGGEHGPHAILKSPDGQGLYLIVGNQTKLTELSGSKVPLIWSEDHLLPRMPDGRGFMRDVLAPGGTVYRTGPDGKDWELISNGFRNQFDAAFNHFGDLFTYDADMEWDMNTPWYRPTRVCLVTSGSEWGWRNGTGKWPVNYEDTLPPVIDIGPGSPTGVAFGYGAKFPGKYQEALFIADWSYGKLYAIHLAPEGSAYTGKAEEFISGAPFQVTDVVINPHDGAMYVTVGGRKTQSGLYRVTYTGSDSVQPARVNKDGEKERGLRRRLEAFHGRQDPAAVRAAWPHLGHEDRFIRFAARVALEHQPVAQWREQALAEKNPARLISAMIALARVSSKDAFHSAKNAPQPDKALQEKMLSALNEIRWAKLNDEQRFALLRAYQLTFTRLGKPAPKVGREVASRLDKHFPDRAPRMNMMLAELMIYLEAPTAAEKTVGLLKKAPTQEEQLDYAKSLRMLKTGWTRELREDYFRWFQRAAHYRGGASFGNFVINIKNEAVANLPAEELASLKPIIEAKVEQRSPLAAMSEVFAGRTEPKQWTVDELAPHLAKGLKNRDFERGRTMFGAAGCFACHRFQNEGGAVGPDLTGVAGRFNARDLLESIILPSKEISDQYAPVVVTKKDGDTVSGRIINLNGDNVMMSVNQFDPNEQVTVDMKNVESIEPSKISPMPEGLLSLLTRDEILDLLAYTLSGGNSRDKVFSKK